MGVRQLRVLSNWHCIRYRAFLNLLTFNFFNNNLILIVPLRTPFSIRKTMFQFRCNVCVKDWTKCCHYCCLGCWGHCWFYYDFSRGCSSKLYYLFNLTNFPFFANCMIIWVNQVAKIFGKCLEFQKSATKGQLISKVNFEVFIWTKKKYFFLLLLFILES